jgi:glutamyl-tRNA reductase
VLKAAVTVGKRVRTETDICKGAVSVSSAAVEFTALKMKQQQMKQQQQSLQHGDAQSDLQQQGGGEEIMLPAKSLANSNVVIVGAGKMSRLLLVHLNSKKVRKVTVVNRSPERVLKLQKEFKDMRIEYRPLEQLWGAVQAADVVYPCTSSATPLITPEELQTCMAARAAARTESEQEEGGAARESGGSSSGAGCPISSSGGEREGGGSCAPSPSLQFTPQLPLRFVDLSVPRNVHPACGSEVAGVECYNVDDLREVVQENTARRQGQMGHAEDIIREEIRGHQRWQESLGVLPTLQRLQQRAEEMRLLELDKSKKDLATLSPGDLQAVDKLSRGLVGKLLRGPMDHLRNLDSEKEAGGSAAAISQFQKTFHSMLKV